MHLKVFGFLIALLGSCSAVPSGSQILTPLICTPSEADPNTAHCNLDLPFPVRVAVLRALWAHEHDCDVSRAMTGSHGDVLVCREPIGGVEADCYATWSNGHPNTIQSCVNFRFKDTSEPQEVDEW